MVRLYLLYSPNLEFKRVIVLDCNVMELTIAEALQRGVATHKAGKLDEAERLYELQLLITETGAPICFSRTD